MAVLLPRRSSPGHGVLSLLETRLEDGPEPAAAKVRRLLRQHGHPLRGPGGGKVPGGQFGSFGSWMITLICFLFCTRFCFKDLWT